MHTEGETDRAGPQRLLLGGNNMLGGTVVQLVDQRKTNCSSRTSLSISVAKLTVYIHRLKASQAVTVVMFP